MQYLKHLISNYFSFSASVPITFPSPDQISFKILHKVTVFIYLQHCLVKAHPKAVFQPTNTYNYNCIFFYRYFEKLDMLRAFSEPYFINHDSG